MEEKFETALGRSLQAARRRLRLSRRQVAEMSAQTGTPFRQKFSSQALATWELATRPITVSRLAQLSELYDLPVRDLLPENCRHAATTGVVADVQGPTFTKTSAVTRLLGPATLRLSLIRLSDLAGDEAVAPLFRWAQVMRAVRWSGDPHLLLVTHEDLRHLAVISGTTAIELIDRLTSWGVLAAGPAIADAPAEMRVDRRELQTAV